MNETKDDDILIVQSAGIEAFEAQERILIDTQIATAKKYPRDLERCKTNVVAIVSADKEIAESCRYAKPVGGKRVTGPSVHLARIVAQQYGNMRVKKSIKQITHNTVIAEAVCFDLENNYASVVEARRSIIGRTGQRYSDSTIETNAMAISSIAERNAILNVVMKPIIDAVYEAAKTKIAGDISTEEKLIARRTKLMEGFKKSYGVSEAQILNSLSLESVDQLKKDHIVDLIAIAQALKDGDIRNFEEAFGRKTNQPPAQKKEDLKARKNQSKNNPPNLM